MCQLIPVLIWHTAYNLGRVANPHNSRQDSQNRPEVDLHLCVAFVDVHYSKLKLLRKLLAYLLHICNLDRYIIHLVF